MRRGRARVRDNNGGRGQAPVQLVDYALCFKRNRRAMQLGGRFGPEAGALTVEVVHPGPRPAPVDEGKQVFEHQAASPAMLAALTKLLESNVGSKSICKMRRCGFGEGNVHLMVDTDPILQPT